MNSWYGEDLSYIHDTGFREYALNSMPGILNILQQDHLTTGLVVDLGCGSGLASQVLHQAGYSVLGIDISAAMIAIAQTRVPKADFRAGSLFKAKIPACAAVISLNECLNYLFDPSFEAHPDTAIDSLFRRIDQALVPGGIFLFDVATPGQIPAGHLVKHFTEGSDWLVLVEKQEEQAILTRRIITLRQVGDLYRRTEEIHRQRLFDPTALATVLRSIGFQVKIMDSYGQFRLPPAHAALMARKPSA